MNPLVLGLITGMFFGFFLQRSEVVRYDRQLGALLFKDMTIFKFMLSAIIVGMIGVYILVGAGAAKLSIKPIIFGGVGIGGLLFGVGWGILGYCPGTSVAALGEGRLDALWGILGMIFGAAIFAELYPSIKKTLLTWGDFGKLTLPQILHINQWIIIAALIVLILLVFWFFEKKKI